ncbi:hypothetical protein GJ496_007436 [Pomphorhynchus laevis]|nr:hypothetical protein GJ496_007436 [Pomphorhynchus laevis]
MAIPPIRRPFAKPRFGEDFSMTESTMNDQPKKSVVSIIFKNFDCKFGVFGFLISVIEALYSAVFMYSIFGIILALNLGSISIAIVLTSKRFNKLSNPKEIYAARAGAACVVAVALCVFSGLLTYSLSCQRYATDAGKAALLDALFAIILYLFGLAMFISLERKIKIHSN